VTAPRSTVGTSDVNLKSVYLCSQALLPLMKRQGRGRIVNISSIAYAAAKGGVSTMTRVMARELAPQGILVNAVASGRIATPFYDRFSPPEKREEKAQIIPPGRERTAEEVADAMVFLASPGANYIVGEVLEVNGGLLMN
jgi:3-oxoacyl-[acyl-carrier protein] reductase